MRTHRLLPALAGVTLLALAGCPYTYTPNDAGDAAWVEQVVPALLGRKPINAVETTLLVDIAAQEGRGAVVDVLMSLPEFEGYWANVLADAMKLQRSGVLSQNTTCWNTPSLYTSFSTASPALADALSTQVDPLASPGLGTFRDADVLRSAIAADDLFAPWRATLFALSLKGYNWPGPARDVFLAGYTNRVPLCLSCHSSSYSSSDISPIPADLDGAVFPFGYGSADGVYQLFEETGAPTATVFGGQLNSQCGKVDAAALPDAHGGSPGGYFAGLNPSSWTAYDVLDLDAALMAGRSSLTYADFTTDLTSTLPEAHSHSYTQPDGDTGFAMLLALSTTEALIKELEGHGMTLPHGHPRVDEGRSYLQGYAYLLVASDWSLRAPLRSMVLAGTFNMRPPSQSTTGYPFPMFFNPWAKDVGGSDVYDNVNGQGDLVHKYSVPSLLRSVAHSLGWNQPQVAPGGTYPSSTFQRTLGRYESYEETGMEDATFQNLLAWEDTVGTCQNPTGGTDWIDYVVTEITNNPGTYTVGDVVIALKDRFIQESDVDDGSIVIDDDDMIEARVTSSGAGEGPDDWSNADEVADWAREEASRDEERRAQREKARIVVADFEERAAQAEEEAAREPDLTDERDRDGAWRDRFDVWTRSYGDRTWQSTWATYGGRVEEDQAVALLDQHGIESLRWPVYVYQSEADKYASYFGVTSLSYPADLVPDLEDKLRGVCGMLLTTPQFMLGGMRRVQTTADPVPDLLVCLPAQASYCDDTALCTDYNLLLAATGHGTLTCPP